MTDVLDSLRTFIAQVAREEIAKERAANANVPELVTIAAYAARMSLSESTVRKAVADGRLDHERIGRTIRISATAKIAPRAHRPADRAMATLLRGRVG